MTVGEGLEQLLSNIEQRHARNQLTVRDVRDLRSLIHDLMKVVQDRLDKQDEIILQLSARSSYPVQLAVIPALGKREMHG